MSQLPAHLQRYQSRDLSSSLSKNLGATRPPSVSILNSRFTLIDAAGNQAPGGGFDQKIGVYLDVCIIDVGDHVSRVYYVDPYSKEETGTPPDCWSDNGVGPSTAASNPQSSTCASCQWAVWGSAVSSQGKAIPACKQYQKLAVIIPSHPQVVFLLRVPPNSHKNLRAYNELSRRMGVDLSFVITRVYFDEAQVGTLMFSGVDFINDGVAQAREQAYTENKTDTIVGRTDVPRQGTAQIVQQTRQGTTNAQTEQLEHHLQNPLQQQAPMFGHQQHAAPLVQPQANPGPFAPAAANPSTTTSAPAFPTANSGAPTAPPSDATPPQRRRRRTQAEIQQANEQAAPATVPPNAPFPHSGQTANALPNVAFGMSEGAPAGENAEVASALNNFFGN